MSTRLKLSALIAAGLLVMATLIIVDVWQAS